MSRLRAWTLATFWKHETHPYQTLRNRLATLVAPGMVIVDGGCGHEAPTLNELRGRGARLIGIDLVLLAPQEGLELHVGDLAHVPLPDGSVDLLYSRSVMEHVVDPGAVYAEARRLLKPGGRWVFLTANRWDYVSLIARITPNRFHAAIVRRMEGRQEFDVFPTAYRTNDRGQISSHAAKAGFRIDRFERLSQYPSMFYNAPPLFFLASLYEKMIMRFQLLSVLRGWLYVELIRDGQ
jgi:SAM-dependent methyltransferase